MNDRKTQNICVVIPIHTHILTSSEKRSLLACCEVLKPYPIYLLKPESLDPSKYIEIAPNLIVESVPDSWMASWEAYNLMKRSLDFYKIFDQYEFMLTYELDCLIFSDNWESCNVFKYDFIGAPWFEPSKIKEAEQKPAMKEGMNSGFSMRNIQKCIKILETISDTKKIWNIYRVFHLHRIIKLSGLLKYFNPLWRSGSNVFFFELMHPNPIHEDYFWTVIVPKMFKFRLAEPLDATKFSFEEHPSYLYEINDRKMPLGCHAWEKFAPEFWRNKLAY